jgi:hypothetical protein
MAGVKVTAFVTSVAGSLFIRISPAHVVCDLVMVPWTSGISICGGGTGVIIPSSSFTRSPIVAPIFALACRKLSDSFSCSHKAFRIYLRVYNRILHV